MKDPVVQANPITGFKLSPQQKRLWHLRHIGFGSFMRCECGIRVKGKLDIEKLQRVWAGVVKRFEILRTTFRCPPRATIPLQVIVDEIQCPITECDLSDVAPEQQLRSTMAWCQQFSTAPFDFGQGPLLRAGLVRHAIDRHFLFLSASPLCVDQISAGNLVREICSDYAARDLVHSETIQYPDVCEWQNSLLCSEDSTVGIDFWFEQQKSAERAARLDKTNFERNVLEWPLQFANEIREACRLRHISPRLLFLAGWQVLLHRLTGKTKITVGVDYDGRNYEELKNAIGPLARTLPVSQVFENGISGLELLEQAGRLSTRMEGFQEYFNGDQFFAGEHRLEEILFLSYGFAYIEKPTEVAVEGVTFEVEQLDFYGEPHQVKLTCTDNGDAFMAELAYDTAVFNAGEMSRFAASLQMILQGLVTSPEMEVDKLEVLGAEERRQLLEEFNVPDRPFPEETKCFHELFEEQAGRSPGATAVVMGADEITYAQLNRRADQIARQLCALGVEAEIRVGICVNRSINMVVAVLGVLKAGGAYVPLDPNDPQERLSFMIEDAQIRVLLSHSTHIGKLRPCKAQIVDLDAIQWKDDSVGVEPSTSRRIDPLNLAYMIYTSGSTGKPKSVMIPHRGLVNYLVWSKEAYAVAEGGGTLVHSSLGFDLTITALLLPLLAGQRVVLVPDQGDEGLGEIVRRSKNLTLLKITPAHLEILAGSLSGAEIAGRARSFVIGGEALSFEQVAFWREHASATRLINEYGPTETVVGCCVYEVKKEDMVGGGVPIGRPIANTQLYVLAKDMSLEPVGVVGELFIGGAGLARGYQHGAALTAEKFVPNPFSGKPGERLYRTGDLVRYLRDGNLEYVGRMDHQVKIRGFRIELKEIEMRVAEHPMVKASVVLAREDEPGEKRLAGYVVLREGGNTTSNDLRAYLKERLPEYMVPSAFVILESMPLTVNGKVDRKALPVPEGRQTAAEFVAPRNELEELIAGLWRELLKVEEVGIYDNFFEAGGHSLLAIRLLALIEKQLGEKIPLTVFFEGATIEHLAKVLRDQTKPGLQSSLMAVLLEKRLGEKLPLAAVFQRTGAEYLADVLRHQARPGPQSSLVAIQPNGRKAPLFLVHPGGGHVFSYIRLAQFLGSDQPCYGLQSRGLLDGQDSHTRIEDMAAYYIQAVQSVQPAGPYLLGGWCMGGVIAFEMARQLHAQNQKVAMLALVESQLSSAADNFSEGDADDLRFIFGASFNPISSLDAVPKDRDQQLAFMLEEAKKAGLVPAEIEIAQARRYVEFIRANRRAAQNYRPGPYPGRVTLFKASDNPASMSQDPALGWDQWAGGGVDIHFVPGGHGTLLYKPHGQVHSLKTCHLPSTGSVVRGFPRQPLDGKLGCCLLSKQTPPHPLPAKRIRDVRAYLLIMSAEHGVQPSP